MRFAQKWYKNEKIRFLFWGLINTFTGFLFFVILYWAIGKQLGSFVAVIGSYLLGSLVSFANFKYFVFKVKGHLVIDYLRFIVVYLPSLAINLIVLPFLLRATTINPYLAQAITLSILSILSYLGHKYFSFFRKSHFD